MSFENRKADVVGNEGKFPALTFPSVLIGPTLSRAPSIGMRLGTPAG
jgi:hypothetical protein